MKKLTLSILAMFSVGSLSFAATNGTWTGTAAGAWSGSQLQGWTSVSTPATSGSYNAGAIANMGTGAWSLWSETNQSESRWTFGGGAIGTGQSYSIDWKNASVSTGNAIQMSLYRSDGSEAFGFRFLGGGTNYEIKGNGGWFAQSSMGYLTTAITLKFDLISSDTYVFSVTRKSDSAVLMQTGTYTLGGTSGGGLTYFSIYDNARWAGAGDLNLNSITVVPEPATWALLAGGLTTVMVIRRRRIG
jgi:hypothetical protein